VLSSNASSDIETSPVNQSEQQTQQRGSGDGGMGRSVIVDYTIDNNTYIITTIFIPHGPVYTKIVT